MALYCIPFAIYEFYTLPDRVNPKPEKMEKNVMKFISQTENVCKNKSIYLKRDNAI